MISQIYDFNLNFQKNQGVFFILTDSINQFLNYG